MTVTAVLALVTLEATAQIEMILFVRGTQGSQGKYSTGCRVSLSLTVLQ